MWRRAPSKSSYPAMPTAYDDLRRRFDDPVRWEYPAGFDYARAVQRFKRFAEELASRWDKPLTVETESHIQDASFHSQIMVPVRAGSSFSSASATSATWPPSP